MSENQQELAERLRQARAAHGKYAKASDAARAMGIEEPTYLGHENGSRGYKTNASRYADFYRVNLEWLLTGRGEMKRAGAADMPVKAGAKEPPRPQDLNIKSFERDLPILGAASCGEDGLFEFNGQTLDYARRPPRLINVKDAYALWVQGDSMAPWREHGELVYVNPHQPPKITDYVVVQMKGKEQGFTHGAYIKRLVRRTEKEIRLLQYNPRKEITLPTSKVQKIHRILDWSELMGI